MPRANYIQHVKVSSSDEIVEVGIDEDETWACSPVTCETTA